MTDVTREIIPRVEAAETGRIKTKGCFRWIKMRSSPARVTNFDLIA
jgi:hypothetical protein